MAIRITGMYSGLDTESIINELASAQSYKKNKLVKEQTKLSWKQDAWKALNTKIYSFYQKLDDLRLESSYLKKKTVVSNPNAIQVTGGTMDGSHSVSVKELSKRAALTSGSLVKADGTHYTGNATLKQLGFSGSGSIRLSDTNGAYVDINVDENMKINDFVKAIGDNTALTASYDQDNQRIYINSWTSGKEGNFFLSGNDEKGLEALQTLKLLSTNDIETLTRKPVDGDDPGGEYYVWKNYINVDFAANPSASYDATNYTADYKKLIEEETLNRLKAMKAQNDALEKENEDYDKTNQYNLDMLKEIQANADGRYDDYTSYITGYNSGWTSNDAAAIKNAGEALYDQIYGAETAQQAKDENGDPIFESDGVTPVYERAGGLTGELKDLQTALDNARDALANGTGTQADVDQAEKAVNDKQSEINKAKEVYSFYDAFNQNYDAKQKNLDTIAANNARFSYEKKADGTEVYKEKDTLGNEISIEDSVEDPTGVIKGLVSREVAAQFDVRVKTAQKVMADVWKADGTLNANSTYLTNAAGTKIDGQDAEIVVDGVTYTSYNDTVTVNGLSITALEKTDKDVNVSTKNDTEGVYSMIKDFIKSYSELINEMDSLYNAESAKDYEPLLAEEKEALTDSEVEEWEKKIKDSLLRRDSTLSNVASALKMDMMKGFEFGGQTLHLSDFGIATLGYFNSADNERNAYHIDGDPDDAKTKNNTDLLTSLINSNPDAVMDFFTNLTDTLHNTLADKMSATKMSSALTVYNDKKMKEDYNDYTDKIKKQEQKLNDYIDKWYAKFSAMETALAKLESKNNSLSSLFGG